jgi:hypothetical protein
MADTEIRATETNASDVSPKVFISHAGEDRERFAKPFAARLRANGVDAWASFWEINPGDSLVDKIFNEGLKNCETFVVVLSNNSIGKPWVREELNLGMVRKIEERSKLIPIRLDECDVPECLKATAWEDIRDLANYDLEFERVLNAIFGMYLKPPIGERPAYLRTGVAAISRLTAIDSMVFAAACKLAIESDVSLIPTEPVVKSVAGEGVSRDQILESLDVLAHHHYIDPLKGVKPIYAFKITSYGFRNYLKRELPEFDSLRAKISVLLATNAADNTQTISAAVNLPLRTTAFFLDSLHEAGLIKMAVLGTASMRQVYEVSPELRRQTQGLTLDPRPTLFGE